MVKAVVAGASGGIGQPLSLLLKTSPLVHQLVLYDVMGLPGVLADLSHIRTPIKITGYAGRDEKGNEGLNGKETFTGADIVIMPAGVPRKPGMTRDQLFSTNAKIVKGLVDMIGEYAPNAFILIISNPVNQLVPVAAEALKAKGVFNPQRLFGVTTLDVVRAQTFVGEIAGIENPEELNIPVIGGHSAHTILPILSQTKPAVKIPMEEIDHPFGHTKVLKDKRVIRSYYRNLIERIQYSGDEVVGAKAGAGSATLSMAYAGFSFAEKVIKAAQGAKGIVECTYVYLPGVSGGDAIAKQTGCDFFSIPVELGTNGAEKAINILDSLNDQEKEYLKKCLEGFTETIQKKVDNSEDWIEEDVEQPSLKANIEAGVNFKLPPNQK